VLIPKEIRPANFVSVDSAWVAGALFASDAVRPTHSKGVRDREGRKVEESKVEQSKVHESKIEKLRVESAELSVESGQAARVNSAYTPHVTTVITSGQWVNQSVFEHRVARIDLT